MHLIYQIVTGTCIRGTVQKTRHKCRYQFQYHSSSERSGRVAIRSLFLYSKCVCFVRTALTLYLFRLCAYLPFFLIPRKYYNYRITTFLLKMSKDLGTCQKRNKVLPKLEIYDLLNNHDSTWKILFGKCNEFTASIPKALSIDKRLLSILSGKLNKKFSTFHLSS